MGDYPSELVVSRAFENVKIDVMDAVRLGGGAILIDYIVKSIVREFYTLVWGSVEVGLVAGWVNGRDTLELISESYPYTSYYESFEGFTCLNSKFKADILMCLNSIMKPQIPPYYLLDQLEARYPSNLDQNLECRKWPSEIKCFCNLLKDMLPEFKGDKELWLIEGRDAIFYLRICNMLRIIREKGGKIDISQEALIYNVPGKFGNFDVAIEVTSNGDIVDWWAFDHDKRLKRCDPKIVPSEFVEYADKIICRFIRKTFDEYRDRMDGEREASFIVLMRNKSREGSRVKRAFYPKEEMG